MSGRYDEYSDQGSQRPPYPARPDGQRQGQAPRGPRQAPPPQPVPPRGTSPQPVPPRGTSPQPPLPQGAPPQAPPPRRAQQPWQARPPQAGGDPRDQRQWDGRARGFDAGPGRGDGNNGFLPGWDGEELGWDGEESFWDDDRGRGRRGRSGARQPVRDRDDRYDEDYARPVRGRRRRFRWLAPLVALLVIATPLGTGAYFGYNFYMGKYHPADFSGSGYGSVLVHVPSGANATSLGPDLQKLGVVASSRALVLAAEHAASSGTLEVGYFKLHMHMQASMAWSTLTNPKDLVQTKVTFPEGLRAASIISVLGQHTVISLSDYQAAIKDTAALGLPAYAKGKVEGYLFPATYQVTPNETALQVLQAMVTKYNQEAQALHLSTAASRVNLNAAQLMIVASLVQAEGGRVSDYPKIASVVYNRLKAHMKLQFDSSVLYGLGKFGTRASNADLTSKSPYNTYMYTGLPPTPIDSPGVAAIEAALKPASTNYLYFFSFANGSTEFSANPITH